MRKKIIAGNWKMNMLPNEAMKFIDLLKKQKTKLYYVYHTQTYSMHY